MENKNIKTKCDKCGNDRIWLSEYLGWTCYVDEESGVLNCKNQTNEITEIICMECGEPFDYPLEEEINFN